MALGQDNSEANYERLRDVKARLSALDGTEALIEGFGDHSGRPAPGALGDRSHETLHRCWTLRRRKNRGFARWTGLVGA